MSYSSAVLFHLLLASVLVNIVQPRPKSSIGYFPKQLHPWSIGDVDPEDERLWGPVVFPDDDDAKYDGYIQSYKDSLGPFEDGPFAKNTLGAKFPVYSNIQDGFVPVDLTALDSVYWWKKRFQGVKDSSADDLPYFEDTNASNVVDVFSTGSVKKRDYTAAQLINMLKALAKARRQRQVRITGKGLRFGISK